MSAARSVISKPRELIVQAGHALETIPDALKEHGRPRTLVVNEMVVVFCRLVVRHPVLGTFRDREG